MTILFFLKVKRLTIKDVTVIFHVLLIAVKLNDYPI